MTSHLTVARFMTRNPQTIAPTAPLSQAHEALRGYAFSCLPVVEGSRLVGVLSRTDLLRLGRFERRPGERPLLVLPHVTVGEVMKQGPVSVGPGATVKEAASKMVERHIHRVLVTEGDKLVGVFSTRDVMDAIQVQRARAPLSDFMSTPVQTIDAQAPLQKATEQLAEAGISGLIVVEDGTPVGVFTQTEALQVVDDPDAVLVEYAMSPAMLCLDLTTSMHRAAAQARATRARRVLAVERRKVWGVLTGLDFARAAAVGGSAGA